MRECARRLLIVTIAIVVCTVAGAGIGWMMSAGLRAWLEEL